MNLILLDASECSDEIACLRDERYGHIRDVLRLRKGDSFRIGQVNGPLGQGEVCELDEEKVVFSCKWSEPPPRPRLELILAMPRPKGMRRLWPQLAALGLARIWIVNAAKVEKPYFVSHVLHPEVYLPLLREGLQQACDTWLPEVEVVTRLKPFLQDRAPELFSHHARWLAHPGMPKSAPDNLGNRPGVIAIGPEGGWTAFEIGLFQDAGFDLFSPTRRILRSDTFCVAALSLAQWKAGESDGRP